MSSRGCSDGGCPFRERGGMATNGGCHCFGAGVRIDPAQRVQLRRWVREMRAELASTTRERDAAKDIFSRLANWSHEFGASLKPPGADTYGEGMRNAKDQVARILDGTTKDAGEARKP